MKRERERELALLESSGLMSYSYVNLVIFLVFNEGKCHIYDIIVLIKLTLKESKRITIGYIMFIFVRLNYVVIFQTTWNSF